LMRVDDSLCMNMDCSLLLGEMYVTGLKPNNISVRCTYRYFICAVATNVAGRCP
jgi:hypothetical protein